MYYVLAFDKQALIFVLFLIPKLVSDISYFILGFFYTRNKKSRLDISIAGFYKKRSVT